MRGPLVIPYPPNHLFKGNFHLLAPKKKEQEIIQRLRFTTLIKLFHEKIFHERFSSTNLFGYDR